MINKCKLICYSIGLYITAIIGDYIFEVSDIGVALIYSTATIIFFIGMAIEKR